MLRILIVGLLLVSIGLVAVPGAVADPLGPPNPPCDIDDETCWREQAKRTLYELDPRNWPCTCDPHPDPW